MMEWNEQVCRPSKAPLPPHLHCADSVRAKDPEAIQKPRRPGLHNRFRSHPNADRRGAAASAWARCF